MNIVSSIDRKEALNLDSPNRFRSAGPISVSFDSRMSFPMFVMVVSGEYLWSFQKVRKGDGQCHAIVRLWQPIHHPLRERCPVDIP